MIPGLKAPSKAIVFSNDAITFAVAVPQLPFCVEEAETICKDATKNGLYCGIVYQYTNRLNGKRYIGQTIHPRNRHRNNIQTSRSKNPATAWGKALKKYQFRCFTYQVLELIADSDESVLHNKLNEKEIYYINLHKSSVKEYGYNIASGGWSLPNEASIEKAVDMFDMDGQYIRSFSSISKANAQFGFTGPTIRRVCNHQSYSAGGYLWAWSGESPRMMPDKRVYTYDENGVYLAEYANQLTAAKELCISYGNIFSYIFCIAFME